METAGGSIKRTRGRTAKVERRVPSETDTAKTELKAVKKVFGRAAGVLTTVDCSKVKSCPTREQLRVSPRATAVDMAPCVKTAKGCTSNRGNKTIHCPSFSGKGAICPEPCDSVETGKFVTGKDGHSAPVTKCVTRKVAKQPKKKILWKDMKPAQRRASLLGAVFRALKAIEPSMTYPSFLQNTRGSKHWGEDTPENMRRWIASVIGAAEMAGPHGHGVIEEVMASLSAHSASRSVSPVSSHTRASSKDSRK